MKKINKRSKAYYDGREASKIDITPDNPYREGTNEYHEWRSGLKDAIDLFVNKVISEIKPPRK